MEKTMTEASLHERTDSAYTDKRDYRTKDVDTKTLKRAAGDAVQLRLDGVDHTARPTWKLRETVEFYRDVLGLPLVHSVSARGWGPANHPDFIHFFFDSGNGSTIAFFYYLGTEQRERLRHLPEYDNDAIHTAWKVDSRETLLAWRRRLEARGVAILYQ